jgi:anti-sigma B factor antagonist
VLRPIDSIGLSVLVMAMKRLRSAGGDLELRSPQPATQRVFDVAGPTKVFAISQQMASLSPCQHRRSN